MLSMKCMLASLVTGLFILCSSSLLAETKAMTEFGDNPGQLSGSYFVPESHGKSLVVLLHGCAQSAEWLANQTGLMQAASEKGFVLLLPQQAKTNNMQVCFNWFSPEDHLRDQGETASIFNMINTLKNKYQLEKTYLIGLSAGGSMVTSMIAQYPAEIEAAAAIAGIGYPCADNLVKALSCMKNGSSYSIEKMVAGINKPQSTHWPDLTLIAGSKDPIVNPVNSEQMAKQWQQLMATNRTIEKPLADGLTATRYQNTTTQSFVELLVVNELGHGWPINSQQPFGGEAAPFVLESSFSTTDYLVTNWGL